MTEEKKIQYIDAATLGTLLKCFFLMGMSIGMMLMWLCCHYGIANV